VNVSVNVAVGGGVTELVSVGGTGVSDGSGVEVGSGVSVGVREAVRVGIVKRVRVAVGGRVLVTVPVFEGVNVIVGETDPVIEGWEVNVSVIVLVGVLVPFFNCACAFWRTKYPRQ
jgi:hypothetical protein